MPLSSGTRLGPYEIMGSLGAGGMGEVYRARDAKLNRLVAIKVLPGALLHDADRLARFRREAQVLAAINHPNIAHLYGVEEAGETPGIVMELVEGPTLADRLASGAFPLDEALHVGRQMAEALEAAHEQGIVHRDLKPGNIKVRDDGVVKVLDFGLAKAFDTADGTGTAGVNANSPTITSPAMTESGVILGTAAYMSPEQARGKLVDKRADIWAFGNVLFEMLAGKRAFAGETTTDTLSQILTKAPEWSALPRSTPAHVRHLLERCLEKNPRHRLRDIGEARIQLDASYVPPSTPATQASAGGSSWRYVGLAIGGLALLAMGAVIPSLLNRSSSSSPLPVIRTAIALPDGVSLSSQSPVAISPDGSLLAFVGRRDLRSDLYIQAISSLEPKLLTSTGAFAQPFFSPDGQWIGFFADGAVQRVSISGGAPIRIGNVSGLQTGGTWAADGTIVFALRGSGLWKINVAGGTSEAIPNTQPAAFPEFLPDGKTILFTTGARLANDAFATIALDGSARRVIARTSNAETEGPPLLGSGGEVAQATLTHSGFLVYGQSPGFVRALRIDPRSLTPSGSPIPLVDSVEKGSAGGPVLFAVSRTGMLFYGGTGEAHELVWVDRAGTATSISSDRAAFRQPRLSPDGRRVAVAVNDETRRSDIWIYDTERGTKSRLTTNQHNLNPQWTPDGARISFSSAGSIVELPAGGGTERSVLMARADIQKQIATGTGAYPTSWSPDGQRLFLQANNQDLWLFSRGSASGLQAVLVRPAEDWSAQFSPDGRWITFISTESGRQEVYVAPAADIARKTVISNEGGDTPRWSRDGHEIFFKQGDAMMVAAVVETAGELRPAPPRRLFAGSYVGTGRDSGFDVSPDGKRFVMVKSDERSTLRQLTVVQNWFDELRRAAAR